MKKIILAGIVVVLFAASCIVYVPRDYGERSRYQEEDYYDDSYDDYRNDQNIAYFYDYLSPYGIWTQHSLHGYIWIPRINRYQWRPYSYGRWIWSDFGWTWVSRYKWGWIPFHYGRWDWDSNMGWYWVPGRMWGPAWVTWRTSNMYIGWAPLPPNIPFIPGKGIFSLRGSIHHRYWTFVNGQNFTGMDVYSYILPFERNLTIMNLTVVNTNIILRNNRVLNLGLDVVHVEQLSKQRVHKYKLKETNQVERTHVSGDHVVIYKPSVEKSTSSRPKRVVERREAEAQVLKRRAQRVEEASPREIEDYHKKEVKILEKSQTEEAISLKKRMEKNKQASKNAVEKKRIEQDYQSKAKKLQERHSAEKKQIKKRHESEVKKEKKRKIKKNI